jgi:hypothetical protein
MQSAAAASPARAHPPDPAARHGIYDQDSAISAIASNRLEPPSWISAIAICGRSSAVGGQVQFKVRHHFWLFSLRWAAVDLTHVAIPV